MDVTKPYKFIGFGAMGATKPYKFIAFGARDATKHGGAEPSSDKVAMSCCSWAFAASLLVIWASTPLS